MPTARPTSLTRGRLVEMPDGLMFMVPTKILPTGLSPLFSWKTKLRMTQELFHPPRAVAGDENNHDESVAAFVEASLRQRDGGPSRRSAALWRLWRRSCQPQRASGASAICRDGAHARQSGPRHAGRAQEMKMSGGPRKPAPPLFTSLKNGMQHLAETVCRASDAVIAADERSGASRFSAKLDVGWSRRD